jgi:hypothetical protein
MSGLVGNSPTMIIVDDPHGYVVPSAGVEIIRSHVQFKTLERMQRDARESVFDRVVEQVPKRGKSQAVDRFAKGKAEKKRLKGLRP